MNVTQIKDAIRNMSQSDKIEIHRWLDRELAGDLPFRIGSRRSVAIRQEIERTSKLDGKSERPKYWAKTLASGRSIGDVKATR
jgi:hypothetical protein